MNSLKTLFVVGILVAVGYGVYVAINTNPPGSQPADSVTDWSTGPGQAPAPLQANPFAPADIAAVPMTPLPGGAAAAEPAPSATPIGDGATSSYDEGFYGITDIAEQTPAPSPAPYYDAGPEGTPPAGVMPPGEAVAGDSSGDLSYPITRPSAVPPGTDAGGTPADSTAMKAGGAAVADDTVRPEFSNFINSVHQSLGKGELLDAYRGLCRFYGHPNLSAAETRQLTELLDQVAGTVVYDPAQHLLEAACTVAPGETLEQIAERYQVPWQMLARINGITDPQAVQPGQQLKVVRGPVEAELRVGDCELTLMLPGRCYAGRFPAGVGPNLPETADLFLV
ncbi:MAG: LysM peptidoglycan-binding domain-containing protein, partial [Thermoguttaceae bacterium]|nr:LysM peptidoglycan-binding domain-containing protein [Thermoguttaceae bacterium]